MQPTQPTRPTPRVARSGYSDGCASENYVSRRTEVRSKPRSEICTPKISFGAPRGYCLGQLRRIIAAIAYRVHGNQSRHDLDGTTYSDRNRSRPIVSDRPQQPLLCRLTAAPISDRPTGSGRAGLPASPAPSSYARASRRRRSASASRRGWVHRRVRCKSRPWAR